MANLFRRAGSAILGMLSSAASPSSDSTLVQVFAKTIAGVIQLFAEDSDGLVYQISPSFSTARAIAVWREDFLNSGSTATAVSGAGSAFNQNQAIKGSPGLSRATIGTTLGGYTFTAPDTTITGGTLNSVLLLGFGELVHETRQSPLANVPDGTNQWTVRVGCGDTLATDQNNGVYFEMDRTTFGDNDWRICAANGGTRTKNTTSTAPVANTFARLRFVVNAAGSSVQAYIDGTAVGSAVTTNIPTTNQLAAYIQQMVRAAGGNTRQWYFDYHETYQVVSR